MKAMVLAGGEGHSLLVECPSVLLDMFSTPEACQLRLICREFLGAVSAHCWKDSTTVIRGSIPLWRACFPRARCANVRASSPWAPGGRRLFTSEAVWASLTGLEELDMSQQRLPEAAFCVLASLKKLTVRWCCGGLPEACFPHLAGLVALDVSRCFGFSDAAFSHLASIRVLRASGCKHLTAAALRWPNLRQLTELDALDTVLEDQALASMRSLQTLCLGSTRQRPEGSQRVEVLAHLTQLRGLHLYSKDSGHVAGLLGQVPNPLDDLSLDCVNATTLSQLPRLHLRVLTLRFSRDFSQETLSALASVCEPLEVLYCSFCSGLDPMHGPPIPAPLWERSNFLPLLPFVHKMQWTVADHALACRATDLSFFTSTFPNLRFKVLSAQP